MICDLCNPMHRGLLSVNVLPINAKHGSVLSLVIGNVFFVVVVN